MTDEHTEVASPLDVVRSAILGSDAPNVDHSAAGVLTALDQAGYAVASHVWVAQLELADDAGGYISVHTTRDGAADALVSWANDNGIDIDLYDSSVGSEILDEHPDVSSYGVSYVPVER